MDAKYIRDASPLTSQVIISLTSDDLARVEDVDGNFDEMRLSRRDSDKSWSGCECIENGRHRLFMSASDRQTVIDIVRALDLNSVADECYNAWLEENPYVTVKSVAELVESYIDDTLIDLYAERAVDGGLRIAEYDEPLESVVKEWVDDNWTVDNVVLDISDRLDRIQRFAYVFGDDGGRDWFEKVRESDADFSTYCNGSQNELDALDTLFETVVIETLPQFKAGLVEAILELINEFQAQKDDLDYLRREYDRTRGTY